MAPLQLGGRAHLLLSGRRLASSSAGARASFASADGHQQLHGSDVCLYGIVADLVCGLDGITEEIGFLHLP
jgi:hypothetical protein